MTATVTALVRGKPVSVPVDHIAAFKADSKYVEAYHPGGVLLLDIPLNALEQRFRDRFMRVHRGVLAARVLIADLRRIDESGNHRLLLPGVPEPLKVSRRYVSRVRQVIAESHPA